MLILLFFFVLFQPNKDVKNSNIIQANYFLEGYESEKESRDIYLWAYNELFISSCFIDNSSLRILNSFSLPELSKIYQQFNCGANNANSRNEIRLRSSKIYALKYGYFSHAIYYLVNQSKLDQRKISQLFLLKSGKRKLMTMKNPFYNH